MTWEKYNPNPVGRSVGDCAVRAVAKALGVDWQKAYTMIAVNGFVMGDMPSSNSVWGSVLRQEGFTRQDVDCPDCPDYYTAEHFCHDHPRGVYVLGFGNHVATVVDGVLYDSWDSSQEIPQYCWHKGEDV